MKYYAPLTLAIAALELAWAFRVAASGHWVVAAIFAAVVVGWLFAWSVGWLTRKTSFVLAMAQLIVMNVLWVLM